MRTFLRIVVSLILLMMALPGVAGAANTSPTALLTYQQGGGEVTYDAPVEGAITAAAFSQDWTLNALAADRISVQVERLDGNLVPSVRILGSDGQEIASSYGADYTYAVALIRDFALPAAGAYTIQVSRRDVENGLTTGAYRLTVTPVGVGEDHPNNTTPVGAITFDTPVTGAITSLHWWHVYTLDGEEGDYIQVTAQRASGTLVTELRLLDSNGQELSRGYSSQRRDQSTLGGYELPYTGPYQVVALRESGISGVSNGGYEMTVNLLGSGEESARITSAAPGVIEEYNAVQVGAITGAQWYQDWQFRTVAADSVTIVVARSPSYTLETPNALEPTLMLLDSAGNDLAWGYLDNTRALAQIERYTLPGEGQYTVRITRDGGKFGVTTGSYEFAVILVGSGEESPLLAEPRGAVTIGEPVNGTIDSTHWLNTWTFSGQEGQMISVVATRTGGTLVPLLEIRDSNGVSQTYAYPDYTYDTAHIDQFRLPYTGDYQIVVFRDSEQNGYTSGGYQLTVEVVTP
jgi:hypothetical protein